MHVLLFKCQMELDLFMHMRIKKVMPCCILHLRYNAGALLLCSHTHTWLKPLYVGKVLATAVGSWLCQQWQFCQRMSTVVDVGPTCHVLGVFAQLVRLPSAVWLRHYRAGCTGDARHYHTLSCRARIRCPSDSSLQLTAEFSTRQTFWGRWKWCIAAMDSLAYITPLTTYGLYLTVVCCFWF